MPLPLLISFPPKKKVAEDNKYREVNKSEGSNKSSFLWNNRGGAGGYFPLQGLASAKKNRAMYDTNPHVTIRNVYSITMVWENTKSIN